jgi:SAM-dependent methyltransferase
MATEFELVHGVDISDKMIAIARRHNRAAHRCAYVANAEPNLAFIASGSVDLVFSNNVLQHNPPDVIRSYLAEFARIASPGGALLFQLPVAVVESDTSSIALRQLPRIHPRRVWNKLKGILVGHTGEARYYRLRRLGLRGTWLHEHFGLRPRIDMFHLPDADVRHVLETHGCAIRHVDTYRYENMLHAWYLAVRTA